MIAHADRGYTHALQANTLSYFTRILINRVIDRLALSSTVKAFNKNREMLLVISACTSTFYCPYRTASRSFGSHSLHRSCSLSTTLTTSYEKFCPPTDNHLDWCDSMFAFSFVC